MAVTLNANTSTGFIATPDTSGVLQLQTGGTAAVTVDASQNVGIGTSSPAYKLDVSGVISSNDTVRVSGGTTVNVLSTAGGGEGTVGTSSNHALQFRTNNTEAMRIDTAGRLLVGTTSLVSGFSAISTIVSATNNSSNITLKDTGTTYGTGTQYISFVNSSNAGAGSIQHTAVTTVAYATTSDLRLKENITDCPSALNIAQQIKVRSYNWKEDGRHVDYGFVAQELNHFFPDAVCQGDDSEEILDPKQTWQVDYGKITPLLLKAIQEQQAIIQTLTDRITLLESK